mmetsp:Transcript_14940/g.33262  ORF Transcript_14940/g.33262 Transcript_14940/m.33262 type:complete len:125 (+) Transcript_14940:1729-2103(+)
MNSNYTEFKFPQIKACQWRKVFRAKTPDDAMNYIGSMLAYAPEKRVLPLQSCAHDFFDELRDERTLLPNGAELPPIFDFTEHERNEMKENRDLREKLIPVDARVEFGQLFSNDDSTVEHRRQIF